MLKKTLMVIAMSTIPFLSVAAEIDARNEATKMIEMQDGSIVYVFKTGKMAVESKWGSAVSTKSGSVMTAKDGSSVTMVGNEVARLDNLLKKGLNDSAD